MARELYDLSIPQEAIWDREIEYRNTSINNTAGSRYIDEEVDFILLREAINRVVKNNDGIRLQFTRIKDDFDKYMIKQYVTNSTPDIKETPENFQTPEEVEKWANERIQTSFGDILDKSLFDVTMFRIPDGHGGFKGGFHCKSHHLLTDALSAFNFSKYVIDVYNNMKKGNLDYQGAQTSYISALKKEQQYRISEKYTEDGKRLSKLSSLVPDDTLSIGNSESNNRTSFAKRKVCQVSPEQTNKIKDFCESITKGFPVSPNHLFQTVFATYFSKITGNPDNVIINISFVNRDTEDMDTLGMRVNTLPTIISLDYEGTVRDNVIATMKRSNFMRAHQKYSYKDLATNFKQEDGSSIPTSNILYSYRPSFSVDDSEIPGYCTEQFHGHLAEPLNLHFTDINHNGEMNVLYDYRVSDFNEEQIEQMHNRIMYIIDEIMRDPDKFLKDISAITEAERKEVIEDFNNTDVEYNTLETPIEIFEQTVRKYPNQIVKFGDAQITYEEFERRVHNVAGSLVEHGFKTGDVISLYIPRGIERAVAKWAVSKAGCVYNPIDTDEKKCPELFRNVLLREVKPKCILTTGELRDKFIDTDIETIDIDVSSNTLYEKDIDIQYSPEDLAYILSTSGTTGAPKLLKIKNKNVVGKINALEQELPVTAEDRIAFWHNYTFDIDAMEFYDTFLHGAGGIVLSEEDIQDPEKLLATIQKENITILGMTPSGFSNLAKVAEKLDAGTLESLRRVVLIGEPVNSKALLEMKKKNPNITFIDGYGPAETTWIDTYSEITLEQMEKGEVDIGKPLPNSKIYILDKFGQPVPKGTPGYIWIGGIGVGDGYLNNSELNETKFKNSPFIPQDRVYNTGDMGTYLPDGVIMYGGREEDSDEIKVNEIRTSRRGIENVMLEYGIIQPMVLATKNAKGDNKLIGFYLSNTENPVDREPLTKYLLERLPDNAVPKILQELDEYPTNSNGKVERKKLLQQFKDSSETSREVILPRTETEQMLCNLLKKYSIVENFSIDEPFENLGGDSHDRGAIGAELWEYGIGGQELIDYNTIEKLAYRLDHAHEFENNKEDFLSKQIKKTSNVKEEDLRNTMVINKPYNPDLGKVFLTGSTGFVGSHIFHNLIHDKTVEKIYCLVRKKGQDSGPDRLLSTYKDYFGENISELIGTKIIPVEGDLTSENLGLSLEAYNEVFNDVTTVIHTAANVKHQEDRTKSYIDNVVSTRNLIKPCVEKNINFAHISTASLAGTVRKKGEAPKDFDENSFMIGQNIFEHPYLESKALAEFEIFQAIENQGLNAKIFRLGNIMPRYSDGKFQSNDNDNAFLIRLKGFLELGAVPDGYLGSQDMELTPVDKCSEAIVKLLKVDYNQTVYHILNNNPLDLSKYLKRLNPEILSIKDFAKRVNESNSTDVKYLSNELNMLGFNWNKIKSDSTTAKLQTLGFEWNQYPMSYLRKIIDVIRKDGGALKLLLDAKKTSGAIKDYTVRPNTDYSDREEI